MRSDLKKIDSFTLETSKKPPLPQFSAQRRVRFNYGESIENEQKIKGSVRFDRYFCKSTYCMQEYDQQLKLSNFY